MMSLHPLLLFLIFCCSGCAVQLPAAATGAKAKVSGESFLALGYSSTIGAGVEGAACSPAPPPQCRNRAGKG
ncbi:hypothetical protein [Hymenobacter siberiensis]|uniref:hypothetical protein n=1 Tax=Hymenobacter siberiensis TaxID=2848396 RepID=UPI001C1E1FD0|nr:hypothetical protein [Hymenobacter siberiensis]MBU6120757.1 hypothetical protein [Hymenobacter siberiensis]